MSMTVFILTSLLLHRHCAHRGGSIGERSTLVSPWARRRAAASGRKDLPLPKLGDLAVAHSHDVNGFKVDSSTGNAARSVRYKLRAPSRSGVQFGWGVWSTKSTAKSSSKTSKFPRLCTSSVFRRTTAFTASADILVPFAMGVLFILVVGFFLRLFCCDGNQDVLGYRPSSGFPDAEHRLDNLLAFGVHEGTINVVGSDQSAR
jgi:hypothetical protein